MSGTSGGRGEIRQIAKQATGIAGLDQVLTGGLPAGRLTVTRGGPGTGKTVLALEILCRQAAAGVPGVFVTFEEEAKSLRENVSASGWDIAGLEAESKLALVTLNIPPNLVMSGDFNIDAAIAIIGQQVDLIGARLLVLDAIDWLLNLFDDPLARARHLQAVHGAMRERGVTGIITVKEQKEDSSLLDYLADCVIRLDQRTAEQVTTRRLRVTKFRGSGFLSNEHPYLITSEGWKLFPVSGMALSHGAPTERIFSGNAQLDRLLAGGYFKGSCILLAGASGTGKTTFACSFAAAACATGEKVLFVTYEESEVSLIQTMSSSGIGLRSHVEDGRLKVLSSLPEAMGADLHLLGIADAIDKFGPDHVVVDAISATGRMGNATAAFELQVRLVYLCKDRGVTCVFTIQTRGRDTTREVGTLDVSSIAECVIALEQDWLPAGFERRLAVVKSRGSDHSNGIFTFRITSRGVEVDASGTSQSGAASRR